MTSFFDFPFVPLLWRGGCEIIVAMKTSRNEKTIERCSRLSAWALLLAMAAAMADQRAFAGSLAWNQHDGVVWTGPHAVVHVDHGEGQARLLLRFAAEGRDVPLGNPAIIPGEKGGLSLVYHVTMADGGQLEVRRRFDVREFDGGHDLVETMELRPARPIRQDVEVVRPFTICDANASAGAPAACVLPLKNGWVRPYPLGSESLHAEYCLGHSIGGKETPELGLPVVQVDRSGWQAAVCADPRFSAQFTLRQAPKGVFGEVRYRYLASRVPIDGVETRSFGFAVRKAPPPSEPFGRSADAFFWLMLPDVPPGPRWLHEIYMCKYDFLSDGGEGWDRDVAKLAEWLTPEERKHVAMCFHGWYDYIGVYAYDDATGRMKDKWVAMPRTRKVPYTRQKLQEQLRRARELGFRVLLYFGDGPNQDSGAPGYRPQWNLLNDKGESPRYTWEGPDTLGKTYIRNPANPEVVRWYQGYMRALLQDYGPMLDGFVWDETSYIRQGDVTSKPVAGYCARGMLDLVKSLTAQVKACDSQKVFLSSDCIGFPAMAGYPDMKDAVGYAMVADGNYQDTWCLPDPWSYALLPNWRNTSWGCIWASFTHYHWMQWGVEIFGAPVSIANGFGDDCGPAEWTPQQRDEILRLFRKRLAAGPAHLRFMTEDPAKLIAERGPDVVPSDPIPATRPGEVNWALASLGSRATASSEIQGQNARYPASGAIDGSRSHKGWDTGHGWASNGAPLPQWLQAEFPQPRLVSRFIVTTYHAPGESARQHGVVDYTIEAWNEASRQWEAVVRENKGRVLVTRVHALPKPLTIGKFRVVVTRVVPAAGGIARLLQVEAWGAPPDAGK
jgi:hypothetical protein